MGAVELQQEIKRAAQAGYPYYVYSLSDSAEVFYVGKGKGHRVFDHGKRSDKHNRHKNARIASVGYANVRRTVLGYFSDEAAAYAYERELIQLGKESLTNIANGLEDPRLRASRAALAMLMRVRPFEQWNPGTPRELFDRIIDELVKEVEDPTPPYFVRVGKRFVGSWTPSAHRCAA